jgi:nitrous oxide reductase accessory protein NosL
VYNDHINHGDADMKTLIINGKEVKAKRFVTRSAAERFMAKAGGEIVYFRSHEYFVSVAI